MEGSSPPDRTNPAAMAEEAVPPESHPPSYPRHPNIIRRRAASARQSLAGEVAAKPSAAVDGDHRPPRRRGNGPNRRLAPDGWRGGRPGKSCRPKIGVPDAGFLPRSTIDRAVWWDSISLRRCLHGRLADLPGRSVVDQRAVMGLARPQWRLVSQGQILLSLPFSFVVKPCPFHCN